MKTLFALVAVSLMTTSAIAGQKLHVDFTTQEYFNVVGDDIKADSAFLSGKLSYKVGKMFIKKSGEHEVDNIAAPALRNLEVLSDNEIRMELTDLDQVIVIPAKIVRNEAGDIQSIFVKSEDYKSSIVPVGNGLDKKLVKMASSKAAKYIPFKFNLEASDFQCKVVESNCCNETAETEQPFIGKQMVCVQTHKVKIGM